MSSVCAFVNRMNIRREHFLHDAFSKVMAISKKDIQKAKLFISFVGEDGYACTILLHLCDIYQHYFNYYYF